MPGLDYTFIGGYSETNHLYTNKGIYSVYDLYVLSQNGELDTIKLMSFDTDLLEYKFVDIDRVIFSEEEFDVYEIAFNDLFTDKVSTINGTGNLCIYQYDTPVIEEFYDYLEKNRIKVNQYMNLAGGSSAPALHFGKKNMFELVNYSVNMPNISLGDSMIKYFTKILRHREQVYVFLGENDKTIPLFIGQATNSYYNFILTDI